jgi:hypothetical protein
MFQDSVAAYSPSMRARRRITHEAVPALAYREALAPRTQPRDRCSGVARGSRFTGVSGRRCVRLAGWQFGIPRLGDHHARGGRVPWWVRWDSDSGRLASQPLASLRLNASPGRSLLGIRSPGALSDPLDSVLRRNVIEGTLVTWRLECLSGCWITLAGMPSAINSAAWAWRRPSA